MVRGIESGVATGWPITDWFEDFMLRINGPDVYDQWVNHEIPFNDPKVQGRCRRRRRDREEPRLHRWRERCQGRSNDQVPRGRLPDPRRQLLHAQAGQLLLHHLARGHHGRPPDGDVEHSSTCPSPKAGDPKYMLGGGDLIAAGTDKPETFDVLATPTPVSTRPRSSPAARPACRPARTSTRANFTDPIIRASPNC